ncbi:THY1 Predicted alternative thymidylate synthase [uncultured Caudovirales phage]|uniref:THY1 Predicted alternative thymidylate synthase n=1 Tax=uncultured Caudovirales phage TaxID=2100421 RepID=A0A6J5RM80_9CAUD|nr:THY1 Predicted alternative thymidylate synthase [uncultured Caudovirales phage]
MTKTIYAPGVFTVSKPQIDAEGILEWARYNGYEASEQKVLYALLDNMKSGAVSASDGMVELCARFCYRAFRSGRPSAEHIYNLLESGHGSVLAHVQMTLAIQGVSRTLTHELVRHHVGVNPSQESQRYVDAEDLNFVVPPLLLWAWKAISKDKSGYAEQEWLTKQKLRVFAYVQEQEFLIETLSKNNPFGNTESLKKRVNEAARCHLPGCSETRLTWTMNMRAARDILGNPSKRGGEGADLEIRRLALAMLEKFKGVAPLIFQDFEPVEMPVINGIKSKFGGV